MGLLQQAYETYCYAEKTLVGVYEADKKEPLIPVGHSITNANIEITVDEAGNFISASRVARDDAITIFPVTELSLSRSSTAKRPHMLCDKVEYLDPHDKEKYELYINQLQKWCDSDYSHPFLWSILMYVKKGNILSDLAKNGIISQKIDYDKVAKQFVRWRVIGAGNERGACWNNRGLMHAYTEYYNSLLEESEVGICMVSGNKAPLSMLHPKKIVPAYANAKLISSNDDQNFTFRGRFLNASEALSISYIASQKAHNALHWIIVNQGTIIGGRIFVCWIPQGKETPKLAGVLKPKGSRGESGKTSYKPSDYRQNLVDIISGWKSEYPDELRTVTAAFDVTTSKSGRLSLVYYSELQAKDFVDRLGFWDETCCWPTRRFGIQSPPLYKIAQYACGTLRNGEIKPDDNMLKQLLLRLLTCRLEKVQFPYDIEQMLVKKAGTLALYEDNDSSKWLRSDILFVTCAVIRKYYFDHYKEEWDMALEPDKKDRSYQYGRLLAVLEKIERDTYDNSDSREPNAIRMQSVFSQRPQYASRIIIEQVKRAYYRQLSNGQQVYYERLIGEIMDQLSAYEDEANKPLNDTYLLGYYLQKNAMYTKKEEN